MSASNRSQLINKVTTAAILWFGAKPVIGGELTIGELVAFNMLAGQVSMPVLRLAQLWQDFQQMRVSVDRLGDILNTPTEPAARRRATICRRSAARCGSTHVSFRYRPGGQEVLSGVSLAIGPARWSASSAVGLRQVDPRQADAAAVCARAGAGAGRRRRYRACSTRAWLRRQIGVVLQENVLFNRSIRENIALADPALPLERVDAGGGTRRRARVHPRIAAGLRHHSRRSAAPTSRAASASASPSRARWSPIRAF